MAKILHESLHEYRKAHGLERISELNEQEQLNESIKSQYDELVKANKLNPKAFLQALVDKKFVSPGGVTEKTKAALKAIIEKMDDAKISEILKKGAEDNFAGRPVLAYADPATKTGRVITYKLAKDLQLASEFKSGGTGGKTGAGGV